MAGASAIMEPMTPSTCANPKCTCDPCVCGEDCKCGGGHLGDLERRVMDVVWSAGDGEVTARDVADTLDAYAYTTVATVLNRLSRKGAVRRRMDGRTTRFAAVGTPADRAAAAMADALDTSGDRSGALATFAARMSADDRKALLAALRPSRVGGASGTRTS